jgi:hypothetical protein
MPRRPGGFWETDTSCATMSNEDTTSGDHLPKLGPSARKEVITSKWNGESFLHNNKTAGTLPSRHHGLAAKNGGFPHASRVSRKPNTRRVWSSADIDGVTPGYQRAHGKREKTSVPTRGQNPTERAGRRNCCATLLGGVPPSSLCFAGCLLWSWWGRQLDFEWCLMMPFGPRIRVACVRRTGRWRTRP